MDPRVTTTLDLSVQRLAQQAAREQLNLWAPYGAGQAALVVVSLPEAEVLAAVGSVDWGEGSVAGSIDFTRTPRPPGSLLKPFAYAEALERGVIQPNTPLFDVGRARDGIHDADGRSLGPLMPRVALGNSRNVPAVALAEAVGLNALFDRFVSLGLHRGDADAAEVGYGLVIGGLSTTALQVAEAYTALALEGQKRALSWVKDQPGEVTRMFSPQVARLVTLWLADPQARLPSFPRMGYSELPFPTAVKTGTSPQARDAWAVAWTDRHLVVAWIGHPDWRPMTAASGYRAGASLAQRVLLELEADRADGLSDTQFPAPEGWPLVEVCPLSGQAATEACGQTTQEHVAEAPESVHNAHGRGRAVWSCAPTPAGSTGRPSEGLPLAQDAAPTDAEPTLALLSPRGGERLTIDPEQPAEAATFALRVAVTPAAEQVLWVIDGEPWALVEAPYAARWPSEPRRAPNPRRAALDDDPLGRGDD
jgi:penicillin-binding protein 1C